MSAEHAHTAHHQDHGHDHGSHAAYIKGFLLSVILTAIPFGLVMAGGFESRSLTAVTVMGFAVAQILVHMVCFLHMNGKQEEGWTMLSTIFTIVVVVILLAGSLWVMYHMNTNMMPQMDHELMQGFGS
ncbi:cytochrome o ubiquinol oxidase subunit IV [Paracoccus kondratievae]|uniref:cytochrome o ubiquinol oxidase subunit IV n=1 Tax=Paracoccus kondratievae TaxID=135740 RepID=UPI0012663EA8|nr:cytochrome o ubiquinol oxidase subunit IV [Paracoccus kondratievae]QFQ89186.1 cytochrome o ubiquinol oxidase subunit IV [Paracoccus kondratievae]